MMSLITTVKQMPEINQKRMNIMACAAAAADYGKRHAKIKYGRDSIKQIKKYSKRNPFYFTETQTPPF
jgi:hypothetical protein